MFRTSPRERAVSTTDYGVRGSRGVGGGREEEGDAAGRAATGAGADAEAGDRPAAALCCSRHSRSRRNRSRRANSTVLDFASTVFSDDDVSTHAAYSANSLAVAVVSSISVFWRLLGSSRTRGPVRTSDLGRPTRFLLLSMTSSSFGWFGSKSPRGRGSSGDLRAELDRETLVAIARDDDSPSQQPLNIWRLGYQRELAPGLVDHPDEFATGRRRLAHENPAPEDRRVAHVRETELLGLGSSEVRALDRGVQDALSRGLPRGDANGLDAKHVARVCPLACLKLAD
jgi:hypothetical protein